MNKHTPGPWEAEEMDGMLWVTPPNRNEPVICDICSRKPSKYEPAGTSTDPFEDEDRANARLIAAAPDLLEVAVTLRDMLQGLYHGVSWFSKEDEEKIHAAIAKATGEKGAFS